VATEPASRGRRWQGVAQKRKRIAADRARGGDIVLRRGRERGVFIVGRVGAIVPWTKWR